MDPCIITFPANGKWRKVVYTAIVYLPKLDHLLISFHKLQYMLTATCWNLTLEMLITANCRYTVAQ